MTIAAVVIATEKRLGLLEQIVRSLDGFDERVVVGDFAADPDVIRMLGIRYLHVPAVTHTTLDALMKRDVGWLATTSDAVLFLSDDHCVSTDFLDGFYQWRTQDDWAFLRPYRYTVRDGNVIALNNGDDQYGQYCGGHGGVYRRVCAMALPWMAGPHHRNWDLLHSQELIEMGLRLGVAGPELAIEDIEPIARPWE